MRIFKKKQIIEDDTLEGTRKVFYKCKECGRLINTEKLMMTKPVICSSYERLECSCGSVHFKIFVK